MTQANSQASQAQQLTQEYIQLSLRDQQLNEQAKLIKAELEQINIRRATLGAQLPLVQQLEQSQAQVKALDEQLLGKEIGHE